MGARVTNQSHLILLRILGHRDVVEDVLGNIQDFIEAGQLLDLAADQRYGH